MLNLGKRRSRKFRSTRFIPSNPDCFGGARVEMRSLTAPAFWNVAPDDPLFAGDFCSATVLSYAVTNFGSAGAGDSSTVEFDNWVPDPTDPAGGLVLVSITTVEMVSSATADAEDLMDPGPPSAPIGNYAVSLNATAMIQVVVTGPDLGVANGEVAVGFVGRNYVLADDGSGGSATNLVEHFDAHYDPAPAAATTGVAVGTAMLAAVATPSLGVTAASAGPNIGALVIDGTPIFSEGSGSLVGPLGQLVTYSWTDTDVHVTSVVSTTSLYSGGVFPIASRTAPFGTVAGVAFPVGLNATLLSGAASAGGGTSQTDLTDHYDASFS